MKLGVATGGAALSMGVSLGCNAVLDIDAGVPREVGATGEGGSTSTTGSTGEGGSTSTTSSTGEGGTTSTTSSTGEGGTTSTTGSTGEGGTTSTTNSTGEGGSTSTTSSTGGTSDPCEEPATGAGGAEVCGDANWAHWRPKCLRRGRYIKMGATVLDPETGLQWQQDVIPDLTWDEARERCENSDLDGFTDWRLPSRIELVSIVDYSTDSPDSPAIPAPFSEPINFYGDYLWSLPLANNTPPDAWCVHVFDGTVATCRMVQCVKDAPNCPAGEEVKKADRMHARCVRMGKPTSRAHCEHAFDTVMGIETVRDEQTGLTWQRNADVISYEEVPGDYAAGAANYCGRLDPTGVTPWRLPTVQELQTIVDHAKSGPAINRDVFRVPDELSATTMPSYWTSTTYLPEEPKVWGVNFWVGYTGNRSRDMPARVRCVHDGP